MVEETQNKKRKILVTGSSGMLGCDLCEALSGNYEVYGIDVVYNARSKLERSSFLECDITDRKMVVSLICSLRPHAVIHAAAWADVDGCERDPEKAYRVNSEGARNVALGCRDTDALLIFISTDYVFDGTKKAPYREEDRTNPLNVYALSKLKGETAIQNTVKRYCITRTSWLFGENGRHFVGAIVENASREGRLQVVDDQRGSPTYTKDLAKALTLLADTVFLKNQGWGIYHISNAGNVSWYEYAKKIVRISDIDAEVIPIDTEAAGRPAQRPKNSILDTSKFYAFTKCRLRGWDEALEEYLKRILKDGRA